MSTVKSGRTGRMTKVNERAPLQAREEALAFGAAMGHSGRSLSSSQGLFGLTSCITR